uniref:Uncharacterized protein n=1 Tax=Rhizophora mucronata TaxID=61149 RepID=A0A2P2NMW2_RHIMU
MTRKPLCLLCRKTGILIMGKMGYSCETEVAVPSKI